MAKRASNQGKKKATARQPKALSGLRAVVAANVEKMLIHKYGKKSHRQWVQDSGISQGTLARSLNGASGLTLETLESVSKALDLAPYQLLVDILDPGNPPIMPGATSDERKLWDQFLQLKKNITATTAK